MQKYLCKNLCKNFIFVIWMYKTIILLFIIYNITKLYPTFDNWASFICYYIVREDSKSISM